MGEVVLLDASRLTFLTAGTTRGWLHEMYNCSRQVNAAIAGLDLVFDRKLHLRAQNAVVFFDRPGRIIRISAQNKTLILTVDRSGRIGISHKETYKYPTGVHRS